MLTDFYRSADEIKEAPAAEVASHFPTPAGWTKDPNLQPHDYQLKAAAWMFLSKKFFLCDPVGLGKTIEALLLIMKLREAKLPYRSLILTPKSARGQWVSEIKKFTDLQVVSPVSPTSQGQRLALYGSPWEVLLSTYSTLRTDIRYLQMLHFNVIMFDEAGAPAGFRNHTTATKAAVMAVSRNSEYIGIVDATPIQMNLTDIHSLLGPLRLYLFKPDVLDFEHRYIVYISGAFRKKVAGYRHLNEFKAKVMPRILRRLPNHPDVQQVLPEIVVKNELIELGGAQRRNYEHAVRRLRDAALAEDYDWRKILYNYHWVIRSCTSTLPYKDDYYIERPDPPQSAKIDWLVNYMGTRLIGKKTIIYCKYVHTIDYLERRLKQIGFEGYRYTGKESDKDRNYIIQQFRENPRVDYIVGTSALERGLNLQFASHVITLERDYNPRRLEQLIGRLRRLNSPHKEIFLINLIAAETIEVNLMRYLSERGEVQDFLFGEETPLWEHLTHEEAQSFLGFLQATLA